MSGSSGEGYCPNCGNPNASVYVDWKPFDYSIIDCPSCGFYTEVKTGLRSKEELEEDYRLSYTEEELKDMGIGDKAISGIFDSKKLAKRRKQVEGWNF